MSRSKNYVFTINNYQNTELVDTIDCKYIVYGKEVGDSGTPHLQGFIVFNREKSHSAAKKALPGAWLEPSKGTPAQAIQYCKKDGEFTERGVPPLTQKEKGAKNADRWALARKHAREGNFDEIDDQIYLTHMGNIKKIRMESLRATALQDTQEKMLWYWGSSGTGKSRKAREDHPEAYLKMCNKWWDDYSNEETVIIEDFDEDHRVLVHHLKIWADRYPFPAEIKGGKINIRPKLLIVTSNYHPSDIWEKQTDLEPIMRRFKCIEFKKLANT